MTSASELFCKRRSRFGRSAVELRGFDSYLDHHDRRRHNSTSSVTGGNGSDSLRRSTHPRHPNYRSERELAWSDLSNQSSSGNINATENGNNRPRFTGNDRLPGAVLLARERVLQRLRGVSISSNRVVDAGEWEMRFTRETRPSVEETSTITQGLTQEASDCLLIETFKDLDKPLISQECGICLESFIEGDELIRLPCEHRFHHFCLDPWVRIRGCCPYCRKDIVNPRK